MALAIGPVEVPSVSRLRALFTELMAAEPRQPLVATIGGSRTRWTTVPPQDRAAHVAQMVTAGDDLTYDDVTGYIERHRPPLDSTLPLTVVVGRDSIVLYSAHLLGDGNTLSRLALMIAQGDARGLAELRHRASFRDAVGVLTGEAGGHWRDWARRVVGDGPSGEGPTTTPGAPDVVEPPASSVRVAGAPDPRCADAVLTTTQISAISAWRNTNARGVSTTAVLASVIYRSLVEQGIPVRGTGMTTLLDLRRYLPVDRQSIYGNLAQNVYLDAALSDPAAIASALDDAIASARPVPGLVADAAMTRLRPPRPDACETLGPINLSLSVMPGLPGLAGLPWLRERGRRYVGFAYPSGLRGLAIFAVRLRDRLELTASYDGRAIETAAVRSALENVGDAGRLLAASP